jgi:hypothetical protein
MDGPDERVLHVARHVEYIQSLDTVSGPPLRRRAAAR